MAAALQHATVVEFYALNIKGLRLTQQLTLYNAVVACTSVRLNTSQNLKSLLQIQRVCVCPRVWDS